MKKIILLLLLPLTTLMAIDFMMTPHGLIPPSTIKQDSTASAPVSNNDSNSNSNEITNDIAHSEKNPYLEPVNLPKCDASNPEVQFIKTKEDWKTINSPEKRIFCVSPGDYTKLRNIKLTTSGTAERRRYIILNNGNDLHPGKLDKSQLANFALELKGASYWVIDRAASFDVNFTHSFIVGEKSTHNIFNRMFTQNLFHTMWIRNKAHYNTIQNSRFDGITIQGAQADLATINIAEWGDSVKNFVVLNTKIINNEFINVKAARLNRFPSIHLPSGISQKANFDGTIFDSNTVEFNNAIRTDCKGNLDPHGDCMAGEANGIGAKAGSNDPNNPVIYSNNHIWGYRPSDPTFEKLSNVGNGLSAYMGSKNIKIRNNIIFDGTRGIKISSTLDTKHGTENVEVTGNLIVNTGNYPESKNSSSLEMAQANGCIMKNNVIINPKGHYGKIYYNHNNNYFGENTIINPDEDMLYKENWETVKGLKTNKVFQTAVEAGYTKDYSFTTDKFTNNPRIITLKNVLKAN